MESVRSPNLSVEISSLIFTARVGQLESPVSLEALRDRVMMGIDCQTVENAV
jgi:hypothetical protein